MFLNSEKHQLPAGEFQKIEAFPCSLGGYMIVVTIKNVAHYAAFRTEKEMMGYMLALLNTDKLAKARTEAQPEKKAEAPAKPKAAEAPKKRGRPPLTEAQKAERKAARAKAKANGVDPSHANVSAKEAAVAA